MIKFSFKKQAFLAMKLMSLIAITSFSQAWGAEVRTKNVGYSQEDLPVPITSCLNSQAVFGKPTKTKTTTIYHGTAVEPTLAVNPKNPNNIVAAWQQDRINNGGCLEPGIAYSFNGGRSWKHSLIPTQLCIGGLIQRISDVWLSFAADGSRVYLSILFFNATPSTAPQGIVNFVSKNGGETWSTPYYLTADQGSLSEPTTLFILDDKNAITADRNIKRNAYTVWDRFLNATSLHSDTYFSKTTNRGKTWSPARAIYNSTADLQSRGLSNGIDNDNQTINNMMVVQPNQNRNLLLKLGRSASSSSVNPRLEGDLLNFMTRTYAKPLATDDDFTNDGFPFQFTAQDIAVIRSKDLGETWDTTATIIASLVPQDPAVYTGGYTYDEAGNITDGIGTLLRTGDIIFSAGVNPTNGNLYVALQTGQLRPHQLPQIGIVTSRDGGYTWSRIAQASQTPINAANPQAFTPSIAITSNGLVGILYYDFRKDTKSDPNQTPIDVWLAIFKEVKNPNGGSTGIGLTFVEEIHLSKRSHIAQNGPTTTQGVMVNGDYGFLVAEGEKFYAAYTKSHSGPFNPAVTLFSDPIKNTLLLLDSNYRQSPYVSVIRP